MRSYNRVYVSYRGEAWELQCAFTCKCVRQWYLLRTTCEPKKKNFFSTFPAVCSHTHQSRRQTELHQMHQDDGPTAWEGERKLFRMPLNPHHNVIKICTHCSLSEWEMLRIADKRWMRATMPTIKMARFKTTEWKLRDAKKKKCSWALQFDAITTDDENEGEIKIMTDTWHTEIRGRTLFKYSLPFRYSLFILANDSGHGYPHTNSYSQLFSYHIAPSLARAEHLFFFWQPGKEWNFSHGATESDRVDVCLHICTWLYGNVSFVFRFKQFDTLHALLSKP